MSKDFRFFPSNVCDEIMLSSGHGIIAVYVTGDDIISIIIEQARETNLSGCIYTCQSSNDADGWANGNFWVKSDYDQLRLSAIKDNGHLVLSQTMARKYIDTALEFMDELMANNAQTKDYQPHNDVNTLFVAKLQQPMVFKSDTERYPGCYLY